MNQVNNPWPVASPFVLPVTVTAEHIDGLMHVNNSYYVSWCEQAAWQHSETLGLSVRDYQEMDCGMAIRHSEYDYIAAARLGERLLVGTWLSQLTDLRITRQFHVIREEDGKRVLQGQWQLVCITLSSGRPRKMPKIFSKVYAKGLTSDDKAEN